MAEMLTFALVLELLERCAVAYPTFAGMRDPKKAEALAHVYHDELLGLSGEALRHATKHHLQTSKFFPKIAELREIAWEWTRRNRFEVEPELADPLWCPRCASRATWRDRYRPLTDNDGYAVLTLDREAVQLVRFQRLLCNCASACLYVPDDRYDTDAMRLEQITWPFARTRSVPKPLWKPATDQPMTPIGELTESAFERAAHAAD